MLMKAAVCLFLNVVAGVIHSADSTAGADAVAAVAWSGPERSVDGVEPAFGVGRR